ncbi:MAG: hypothetical protein MJY92_04640 [Bacteroidales bacterium]|nr:hypothetical protein [Bacteroidales bacterium]
MTKLSRFFVLLAFLCSCASSCSIYEQIFLPYSHKPNPSPLEMTQGMKVEGILEERFYKTSIKGPSQRRMLVYLPADYYSSDKRYPVVYLLHGARGNETAWILQGEMISTVDSLTRIGRMPASIIVALNCNQYDTEEQGMNSSFKSLVQALSTVDGGFEASFMRDVLPYVDREFRTIPDKQHRAIAGLSLGSLQSAYITATWPDCFDYVGLFSPIFKTNIKKSEHSGFYNRKNFKENMKVQFAPENRPKRYSLMIGRMDLYYRHSEYESVNLAASGYPHDFIVTGGRHDWPNWIAYLKIFLDGVFLE